MHLPPPASGRARAHSVSSAQIVGLKSGWHAAAVMGTSQFHGLRLAHAAEMRLELLAHGAAPHLLLTGAQYFSPFDVLPTSMREASGSVTGCGGRWTTSGVVHVQPSSLWVR